MRINVFSKFLTLLMLQIMSVTDMHTVWMMCYIWKKIIML